MKIIHCADFHLDSQLHQNLTKEQAAGRRNELLETFLRIVAYAVEQHVRIILISGDLFDSENITQYSYTSVLRAIQEHPDIVFFYITGNHEKDAFLKSLSEIPKNLKLFRDHFISYRLAGGGLTISGRNCTEASVDFYEDVVLPKDAVNLVLLHGDIESGNGYESVSLSKLSNRNIDYLALGHLHSYRCERIDARGLAVYCGCPEGRGFDEPGAKGFVLMDVDLKDHVVKQEFVPFCTRMIHDISVDVTGCGHVADILSRTREALVEQKCQTKDYVKVTYTGELPSSVYLDSGLITTQFENSFYAFKVSNHIKSFVEYETYIEEPTLRGEFLRLVKKDYSMSEEQRNQVLRMGLQALSGEEVRP